MSCKKIENSSVKFLRNLIKRSDDKRGNTIIVRISVIILQDVKQEIEHVTRDISQSRCIFS